MGHAVRQFEKEASRRLETGVEYVAWNCKRRAVRQFEVSFKPETELGYLTLNCMGRTVCHAVRERS